MLVRVIQMSKAKWYNETGLKHMFVFRMEGCYTTHTYYIEYYIKQNIKVT